VSAREWLDSRKYKYELVDVEANRSDYDAMIKLSGQSRTPTLLTDDGKVLPDFGPEELEAFVKKHNLNP
jgi:glutaredoxin